jgi:NADH-quinone oxidoreductase subunit A
MGLSVRDGGRQRWRPANGSSAIRTCRAVLRRAGGPGTAHSWPCLATAAETRLGFRDPSTQLNAERTEVLAEYLPTLLFLIVATGIGIALIVVGNFLGPKRFDPEKLSPYECGFNAFEDARMRFDVRYYLIAILFIVFDLEIAFVYPWALVFRDLGVFGLIEMGVFLGLLLIGFIYVWKKGALEWE